MHFLKSLVGADGGAHTASTANSGTLSRDIGIPDSQLAFGSSDFQTGGSSGSGPSQGGPDRPRPNQNFTLINKFVKLLSPLGGPFESGARYGQFVGGAGTGDGGVLPGGVSGAVGGAMRGKVVNME